MKLHLLSVVSLLCLTTGYSQVYYPTASSGMGTPAGSGSNNTTHIGNNAGASVTTGHHTVFVGTGAGFSNTTGGYNTAVGFRAGNRNQTGIYNTFIGSHAGDTSTVSYNTFVGTMAGQKAASGQNVFLGVYAGRFSTNGNNAFVGFHSGHESTSGSSVFVGFRSGYRASGHFNVCIGNQAASSGVLGSSNVIIGRDAGMQNTGNDNVFMGAYAGKINTGAGNVFIGSGAGNDAASASYNNTLLVGNNSTNPYLIYGQFKNGSSNPAQLKFNASKVGIGDNFGAFPALSGLSNANYRLFVKGGIIAEEVRVRVQPWPDYVFANDYCLMPLTEVAEYIAEQGHLPNMPSACEVEEQGLELGNIVKLQQEKIEELTLHVIEQDRQIESLKTRDAEFEALKAQVQQLLSTVTILSN